MESLITQFLSNIHSRYSVLLWVSEMQEKCQSVCPGLYSRQTHPLLPACRVVMKKKWKDFPAFGEYCSVEVPVDHWALSFSVCVCVCVFIFLSFFPCNAGYIYNAYLLFNTSVSFPTKRQFVFSVLNAALSLDFSTCKSNIYV